MAAERGGRDLERRGARLLIELLRPAGPRLAGAGAAELIRAAELGLGHGLFLLVDRAVRERAGLPSGAAAAYERVARPLRLRLAGAALELEEAEERALELLGRRGVASVLLKGSALGRTLYGEAHLKASADVDLLVRAADVRQADEALRGAGYRRGDGRPLAFWMRRLHHAAYTRRGGRHPVELHWGLSIPGYFDLDETTLWEGVALEGLQGRLTGELRLVLLFMHHHLHGCADLRTLVDLAWALERLVAGDAGSVGRLQARFERIGLRLTAQIALRQLERLWGPVRRELGVLGGPCSLRARALARLAMPRLERDPGRAPGGALVPRLALDSPASVLRSFVKTAFPPAADVRAFAPAAGAGVAGYVQYWNWRWRGERVRNGREGAQDG